VCEESHRKRGWLTPNSLKGKEKEGGTFGPNEEMVGAARQKVHTGRGEDKRRGCKERKVREKKLSTKSTECAKKLLGQGNAVEREKVLEGWKKGPNPGAPSRAKDSKRIRGLGVKTGRGACVILENRWRNKGTEFPETGKNGQKEGYCRGGGGGGGGEAGGVYNRGLSKLLCRKISTLTGGAETVTFRKEKRRKKKNGLVEDAAD